VILDVDHELHLKFLEHSYGTEGDMFDEGSALHSYRDSDLLTYVKGRLSTAIAALTLAFARSCGKNLINDDILIIVQQQLNPGG
jgi:hypothetical protein